MIKPLLRHLILFALIATGMANPVQGAIGSIRGQVVDEVTQSPIPGASIVIVGTTQGTVTDADGNFVLEPVNPGVYQLQVSYLGYETQVKADIVVQTSRPTVVRFELRETTIQLGAVTVQGSLFERASDAVTSVQVLGAEEIRRTPGGQNDISRTLLNLPGVSGGVDNRNDLLVRGGGPSENAYYVDGVPVPQINHFATQGASGGALGLLNIDFIRETEFYTGGFPVRYGDALSSVLVINNRPGSPDGVAGDFTLGAIEAALTLDGPAGKNANWLLSARRSYLQYLFQALGLPIRPSYWDFQARYEANIDRNNRLTFVGIGAIDQFDFARPENPSIEERETINSVLDNDQWTYTNGLVWRHLLKNGFVNTVLSRSMTSYTFADNTEAGDTVLRNNTKESENHLIVDADVRLRRGLALGFGGGATLARTSSSFFEQARPGTPFDQSLSFEDDVFITRGHAYGQLVSTSLGDRLTTTAGLRLDGSSFLDRPLYLSPRLSASYRFLPDWWVNASTGVFHQHPAYISLLVREQDGSYANRGLPYIRSNHYVAGLAWQARPSLRATLEGYYKSYHDYPVSRSDARISMANLGGDFGYVGVEPLLGTGEGRAYGAELAVQKKLVERLYGTGSYSLSWSEFAGADGVLKPSSWDVRHNMALSAGYRLSKNWELGVKWRFLSGRPFTPFDIQASSAEYAISGRGVPDYDRLNSQRTPAYHRLDVRVDRRFSFSGWNAVVYFDIQNVYNRTNLFGFEYTQDPAFPNNLRPVDNIGLLPNFGFSIEW